MVQQLPPQTSDIIYPESDGKPLADNTLQFRWIVTLKGGIDALFKDDPNVFVAGDLLWYPVQGQPKIVQAPDVMVAIGRPKGDRCSYKQWEEDNIPPQVVFEISSKSNTVAELEGTKLDFYQRHGVEEYYLYDPDRIVLKGWLRSKEKLESIELMLGWVSPRLGIRFEIVDGELQVFHPNGNRFRDVAEYDRWVEEKERQIEERERQLEEKDRRIQEEQQRSQALMEQLRALGVEPVE
ncbi:Uma2 family endonuclease [Lusitaniella coriacea LEGE 07157]|uniref:Uma2 family endonuclease n=1 Tax=Lusitaniella coriacea LEGE 07157 TaxID=945747 RepID=A0A8J7DX88_9CYAN|nr:Uma2 family endonuclease [Lusitaniella coriacea]MBE9116964.1 Uma2 family endonuclease [Lusitaniella coriacea LEGE 07157]